MKLIDSQDRKRTALLLGVLFQFGSTISTALSPDPRLLSLVPPDSQIVAGASAPSKPGQGSHFLFVSRANHFDFADFVALAASDPSHEIREVILTTTISDPCRRLTAAQPFSQRAFRYHPHL